MSMIEPDSGRGIPGVSVPAELYWVLMTPAPLAGMKYPRQGFPWRQLAVAGFARLVALHPGSYDPSPLSILCSEKLQDLVGGGLPRNPDLERETIERVVRLVVEALRVGDGVVIHCVGGRGRTGTVLGCVLRELGYDATAVCDYLDRVHKTRGKPGWPESPWQAQLVRAWRPDL
jgi:hypothetical protein